MGKIEISGFQVQSLKRGTLTNCPIIPDSFSKSDSFRMKKIKKKKGQKKSGAQPAFVIGYSHADAPPPGYLAAWFNQLYGGPLQVNFMSHSGHTQFEAAHTNWRVAVNSAVPAAKADTWQQRLQWSHLHVAEVTPLQNVGQDKRDVALHTARIAKGITFLTEGTAYDFITHSFLNPSDWHDLTLGHFAFDDHVKIEQIELLESSQIWFFSLGLAKFGLEEIETFRPIGLPDQPVIDKLLAIGNMILASRTVAKVGDRLALPESGQLVTILGHRTDQSTGRGLQLREVKWE